jgi:integrase
MKGQGSVYQRGRVWWVRYYVNGHERRESTRTSDRDVAVGLLRQRLAQVGSGRLPDGRVTFDALAATYLQDRELRGAKGDHLLWSKARVANLKTRFGGMRATEITTSAMREYAQKRLAVGASPGTINRDLGALSRMFTLALQSGSLAQRPYIPRLKESLPRQGFFEADDYTTIRSHLPAPYQDVLDFAYFSGWRRGEILTLEWRDVDRTAHVIRLRPEVSKNREGRLLVMSRPLQAVIERRWKGRTLGSPHVFSEAAAHLEGFKRAWQRACKAAGRPEKLFHDLRRSVVRNLIRSGVPERVAMQMSGHKTRSVFDRYNIVSEGDLRQAAEKLAAFVGGA